eukprot:TRINITY_DN2560_c0_g2_i1.p1 TRINITY_DN2560_c0_g2~~TRINITY_DN2560_c0_g2_i1.p1  ORF type:complete len:851 (-),score=279.56 TRINITY_DN2560_c0_g2_i1:22-2574(-)
MTNIYANFSQNFPSTSQGEKIGIDWNDWGSIFNNTNPDTSTQGLSASTWISAAAALLALFFFCLARDRWLKFFSPKSLDDRFEIPKDPIRFIGWIWVTIKYPEKKLFLRNVGLDGVMYLRFLKYSMLLLASISILGNVILTPINSLGPNKNAPVGSVNHVSGLDIYSLANIADGDKVMWAHLFSVFIFSLLTYHLIYRLFDAYIRLDQAQNKPEGIRQKSVLVTNLPEEVSYSSKKMLNYFSRMFGKKAVHQVLPIPHLEELSKLQNERNDYVKEYKRSIYRIDRDKKRGIEVSSSQFHVESGIYPFKYFPYPSNSPENGFKMKLFGRKVESAEFWKEKIQTINEKMGELQDKKIVRGKYTNKGFVCFDSIGTSLCCQQTLISNNPFVSRVYKAPHPHDICWKYLSAPSWELRVRKWGIWALIVLLFVFWFIPVFFVTAWTRLETLSKVEAFSGLVSWIEKDSVAKPIVESFLPTLAYTIFMSVLPYLIQYMLSFAGFWLYSTTERHLVRSYWYFLFFISFLGYVFASSAIGITREIVESPGSFTGKLGTLIAKQAAYFANYVVLQGWAGYAIFWLARFDEWILYLIKRRFFCVTSEERKEAEEPMAFNYGILYTRQLFVLLIAIVYSTMAPYVVPFALSYFGISWFAAKYNMVYVVKPRYQGGKMTLIVINRVSFTLLIYQLAMVGIFSLKSFPPGLSVIGLAIGTIFYIIYNQKRYRHPFFHYPLDQTHEKEDSMAQKREAQKFTQLFHHPGLTPPDENHEFTTRIARTRLTRSKRKTVRSPDVSDLITEKEMERIELSPKLERSNSWASECSIATEDFYYNSPSDSEDEVTILNGPLDEEENPQNLV